jgi:hypothetical protein
VSSKVARTFRSSPYLVLTPWIVFLGPYDDKSAHWSFVDDDPFVALIEATPENIERVKIAIERLQSGKLSRTYSQPPAGVRRDEPAPQP